MQIFKLRNIWESPWRNCTIYNYATFAAVGANIARGSLPTVTSHKELACWCRGNGESMIVLTNATKPSVTNRPTPSTGQRVELIVVVNRPLWPWIGGGRKVHQSPGQPPLIVYISIARLRPTAGIGKRRTAHAGRVRAVLDGGAPRWFTALICRQTSPVVRSQPAVWKVAVAHQRYRAFRARILIRRCIRVDLPHVDRWWVCVGVPRGGRWSPPSAADVWPQTLEVIGLNSIH